MFVGLSAVLSFECLYILLNYICLSLCKVKNILKLKIFLVNFNSNNFYFYF